MSTEKREEKDALGALAVPSQAYWGVHTQRALENFALGGPRVPLRLIYALALVKKACCLANEELRFLPVEKGEAIRLACDEILEGRHDGQFPLEALQGGAGTSTNMNLNEVIANIAAEKLGGRRGDYARVHPVEDVNLHQSTNDVYPTALKIAAIEGVRELSRSAAALQEEFQKKEKEFAGVPKIGRTEMQEAVPLTLGAEFSAFAEAAARDRWRTFKCEERLRVINLGGTAVGTGLTAPHEYIFLVAEKIREVTGLGLSRFENGVDQTANADAFVEVSGILKAVCTNLLKICGDLRLLHFLGEIRLEPRQVGSSVMPGKVNPVILECVMQAAMRGAANDALVGQAASRGTLQICEWLPLLGAALLETIDLLINALRILAAHVSAMGVDEGRCRELFENSPALITAFLPQLGYEKAGELVREYRESGRTNLKDFLAGKLGRETVEKTLSAHRLTALGYRNDENDA